MEPQTDVQAAEVVVRRRRRPGLWLKRRLSGLFALDTRRWRSAIAALWLLDCATVAVSALGMPTGFGTTFDVVTALSLNTIALPLASWIVAALIALVGLRVPRATAGSAIYTGVLLYCVLYFTGFGIVGSIVYAAAATLLIGTIGVVVEAAFRSRRNALRIGLATVAAAIIASVAWLAAGQRQQGAQSVIGEVQALSYGVPDASVPGNYTFDTFTYGSGEDKRRSEFGDRVGERTDAVDASAYIEDGDWSWLREKFWGFDEYELPLNGRVWMPEGDGPYPLVLMVHGNHLMEDFSDEGYAYLGELLASRGIIAISVDENFLNYSAWSGIPDQDMKLRAWTLLQHIGELQRLNAEPSSRLFGRIDFDRIALLGHSRGGQAVAMATDRSQWFEGAASLPAPETYRIQAVVAIAPTDTYVDGKQAQLRNVSYLTLQGAKDADLVNFYGDRQYARTTFDAGSQAFKASLYIAGANHSQFNTTWGSFDNSYPGRLFVRPTERMDAGEQRQIAKLYVSAFLETAFGQSEDYRPLFRDYRAGLDWLPATAYYSQYQDGSFRLLADFNGEDREHPASAVTAAARGMTDWKHADALNRQREGKGDQGVFLQWDSSGEYTMKLGSQGLALDEDSVLTFSIAELSDGLNEGQRVQVELTDRQGASVRMPLSSFMSPQGPPKTDFTWLPGMDAALSDRKYAHESEPVYQTVELPFRAITDEDPDFSPSEWTELTLSFEEGPGNVMIDDLGVMP